MKFKKFWISAIVLFIFVCLMLTPTKTKSERLPKPNAGRDPSMKCVHEQETLKGLKGVQVSVVNLSQEVENYGFTKQELYTDIESRLRQNGIAVLSQEELLVPTLLVRLTVKTGIVENDEIFLAHIHIELGQLVFLERDPRVMCFGTTWTAGGIKGGISYKNIKYLRDDVKHLVDKFCNAYHAVNPKESDDK
ncbi:MAG: hypothetical protein ACYSSP_08675 [Planctomycetota bacterium]|jgi:hypothetical protein